MSNYGWGTAIGKIFDYLPGRKESLRNKAERLEKEIDAIYQSPHSDRRSKRLVKLTDQLHKVREKLKNS